MKRKRIMAGILCFLLLLGTAPAASLAGISDSLSVTASADDGFERYVSGTCGDNISWVFDKRLSTLTISGTGAIPDFSRGSAPWDSYCANWSYDWGVDLFVTIGYGITRIGDFAFDSMPIKPWNVTIPDSVMSIGAGVFYTPAWQGDVLYIGHYLIRASNELTGDCVVTDGTRCIAEYAFSDCSLITSVTIPGSVSQISDYAFNNCKALTSVTIPDSVGIIGKNAFWGCEKLSNLVVPDSVTYIGENAFYGCSGITDLVIPDSVTHIGKYAFCNCEGITNVAIGSGVINIEDSAFSYCLHNESFTVDENNTAFSSDENGVLFNKNKSIIIQYPAGRAADAFLVPNSVTTIGRSSFIASLNLTRITIPNCLTSIGDHAFEYCMNLQSITIPDSVKIMGALVFCGCSSLSHIKMGNGITSVDESTFFSCSSMETIIIGNGVTAIGYAAFAICTNLKSVHIPSSVIEIDDTAFASCDNLEFICSDTENCYAKTYAEANGIEFRVCEGHAEETCEHDYTSAVTTEPTCAAAGVRTYTCTICGDSYTEDIEKIAHTPEDVTEPATCTAKGRQYTKCSVCGETLSEAVEIPALDHAYNAVVTKEPTCTDKGVTTYTCSRCGDSYTEDIEKTAHLPEDVTEAATCTADGRQYTKCSVCGETIGEITVLPKIAHSFGAWVTVKEATTEAEGLQERTCLYGCGTKETQVLPKIPTKTVEDTDSGISLTYPETAFADGVELKVQQVFDGAAFNLVDLNSEKNAVFDIVVMKDGTAVQPNGIVTVRIPVPAGFDPVKCMIYHVSTETGKLEKMLARYENGYMVFETDHFSFYAIVIEKPVPPIIAIKNYTANKTVDYRTTITFSADVTNPVDGAAVHWFVNGQDMGTADTYTEKESKATYTVQAKYMKDGAVLAESETETVNVKTGFFAMLKAFFRALFGRLPKQVQEAYDLDLLLTLLP